MASTEYVLPSKTIPVVDGFEVVVAGGGVAGLAAAVSSARAGARTLIVESNAVLGGAATAGGMNHIGAYDPAVIAGFCGELVERLEATGRAQKFHNYNLGSNSVVFDAEQFRVVVNTMLSESGVEPLFLTSIQDVIVEDERLKGIVVHNKSGLMALSASAFVDATGDGDVAASAGAPFEVGRTGDGRTQATTLMFQVAGIDYDRLIDYLEANEGSFREFQIDKSREQPQIVVGGFETQLKEAFRAGELSFEHEIIFINGTMGAGASINATHMLDVDGTDAWSLSRAQLVGTQQVVETMAFLRKYVPGFEDARIGAISNRLGVRETRRIMGEYVVTQEDLLDGRSFPDVIGRNSAPMDIHSPNDGGQAWTKVKPHGIPLRSLIPLKVDGLLTAGRCISVTHEALASVRFQPACMVTGQAAGVTAALSASRSERPRDIEASDVQAVLREQGAILE